MTAGSIDLQSMPAAYSGSGIEMLTEGTGKRV